jgi:hypothetical protein
MLMVMAVVFSCKKSSTQTVSPAEGFSKLPQYIPVSQGAVPEASGIADSRVNPGYLWVEEDSGNPPQLYLMAHDGKIIKALLLENGANRDWEDIAVGAGPDNAKAYVYIGDIGDNNLAMEEYVFYRFEEPLVSADKVTAYDKLFFTYPDGPHDAEAFLVDGITKDIYLITKRDEKSRVYVLPYPQDTAGVNHALYVADLTFNGVVSAALSPDNKEIILKTYTTLYYYQRNTAESIGATLAGKPSTLGYQLEAQGEAVTFATDHSGFYTLSEKGNAVTPPTLNFYKRY